jgi:outer membrane protein
LAVRTFFFALASFIAVGFCTVSSAPAQAAETLDQAMASAYSNNPSLNAERARLRATDESVPQALSAFRPSVSGSISASASDSSATGTSWQQDTGVSLDQSLFTGNRNTNALKSAETSVLAGRETLRGAEQTTLLNAVTAFMNLVQAQATLNLRNQNIEFLREQVRAAEDRLNVGEGTRTEVAQTNSALAAGQSDYYRAASTLNTAIAVYQQVIGHKPQALGTARSVDNLLPKTLEAALAAGLSGHPTVKAAALVVDSADFAVKSAEGSLLPSATLSAGVNSASVSARVSVPIWSGGAASSRVRAAKETLGQRRIELDAAREQVRQLVVSAWGSLDAARASIRAADAQVAAQELVLAGVMEERRVGQATTLEVLDAQQRLLNARVGQVTAQRDRVVAAYTLLGAIGLLSADYLHLNVEDYDPTSHYLQVRDLHGGTTTPDGR